MPADGWLETPGDIVIPASVHEALREGGGRFVIAMLTERADNEDGFVPTEWMVGMEWGKEAPDSDMAAAAAYGTGETVTDALRSFLTDGGFK